jgi:hypothetical protein
LRIKHGEADHHATGFSLAIRAQAGYSLAKWGAWGTFD